MRRAAAVRARQRKLREENANQEAESLLESEVSAPAAATKGGRNRKGGVSRQKETNSESEDQGVENKEGHSVNGDSSEEQYEVEKIVDMKVIRGVRKYRIRWKGYDSESDTWETADNLNCPNALQEYLNQNSKSEDVSVTSGRKRASKADVVAEEAATNNIQNTEKDTSSKDEGEDMPPAKKRKSSKVAKPTKNDESADDEKEEEEEKTVEPPVKKRKSKIEKPAKTDNESADDEDEKEENEEKTVEPPAKKRKSRVSKPAKSDDESADDENEEVKNVEPPAKNRKLSRVSKPAKSDDESANDENEEEQKTVEEPPAKEKTAKIGRTKAKGKKEETVSSEDTENGVNTDETSYEVEKIMEVHHKKNGKKEYLIHWRGYPHSQDTWEPEENLDCEELIREFEERVNKAKNLSVRELRTERVHTNRYAEEQSAKRHSKRGKGKKRTTYYDTE